MVSNQFFWLVLRWMAFSAFAACWAWPIRGLHAQGLQQSHVELVCPCEVSTNSLTSITVSFGIRNFRTNGDSGPMTAILSGRLIGSEGRPDGAWTRMAKIAVPAVAANSRSSVREYTTAFTGRVDSRPGSYQLQLQIFDERNDRLQFIRWIARPVELGYGGHSYTSVYFGGIPSVALGTDSAELTLPVIKNASSGNLHRDIEVMLTATRGPSVDSSTIDNSERHALGVDLAPGGEIAEQSITLPLSVTADEAYVHVMVLDGSTNHRLAFQTVSVPDGEALPTRTIDSGDASLLVDSDSDGVGDVNERLAGTDHDDDSSTPDDPTIDVLALYQPNFPTFYGGNPTTRISHVLNVAENIYKDSGVGLNFRLVGILEAQIDEPAAIRTQQVNDEFLREAMESHGADLAVLFHALQPNSRLCGWATMGGWKSNGVIPHFSRPLAHVVGNCRNIVAAHEIGHVMGLGHSYAQNEAGTYRWSRGHGVRQQFVTVMAYWNYYDYAPELDVFSSPQRDCKGRPCGVAISNTDGADAVKSLNITRFQVADYGQEQPDSDNDGFVDPVDAFPNDAEEYLDTDGDGVGNSADTDDDGDGISDGGDAFPIDDAEWADTDGDGVGDNTDAFPNDRLETLDTDRDGVGDNADRFPNDASETVDTDNDGVGNNGDAFPYDTKEWRDTDGDGVGDNADDDADGDGVPNAIDLFPSDAERTDSSSYRFQLPEGANQSLSLSSAGDIDGDGRADFLVAAVDNDSGTEQWTTAVYLVAAADLAAADAADGTTDRILESSHMVAQPNSWKFVDEDEGSYAGMRSVAMVGDVDDDDVPEMLIGAPSHGNQDSAGVPGTAYLISLADLPTADSADGNNDGVVQLTHIPTRSKSWRLVGEAGGDGAGQSVQALGDIDGDDVPDLAIGAPGNWWQDPRKGAIYVISGAELEAADRADGDRDWTIELGRVAARADSWKLMDETEGGFLGRTGPVRHLGRSNDLQLIVAAPEYTGPDGQTVGAAYVVSSSEWAAADAADGVTDGVIDLGEAVSQPKSKRIVGQGADPVEYAASIGDHNGDAEDDILVRSKQKAFYVSAAHLNTADASDGSTDGQILIHERGLPGAWEARAFLPRSNNNGGIARGAIDGDSLDDVLIQAGSAAYMISGHDLAAIDAARDVRLDQIAVGVDSWRFDSAGNTIRGLGIPGDVDADGHDDLLLGTDGNVFVVVSSELRALDAADDRSNGLIQLSQMACDADGDGVGNILDADDDNDGVVDFNDLFPHDSRDWADTDGDGVGDNTDAFPDDATEQFDIDSDGMGDRADTDDDGDGVPDSDDTYPLDTDNDEIDNVADTDDDNDGVPDLEDAFPLNASESVDTDGDGTGNVADNDDDNDGVADADDAFPLNPDESADSDDDGYGDNADAFDNDASEWIDTDGDGTGNNADSDDDGDGEPDNTDAFPLNAAESADADGDGVGDNADVFPTDASEWLDTDADGAGDNADSDDDNDGHTDAADAFPLDKSRQRLFYYRLGGEKADAEAGRAVAGVGDADGDGIAEVLVGSPRKSNWGGRSGGRYYANHGVAYVVSGADLAASDKADGLEDGHVGLQYIAGQPKSWAITGARSVHQFGTSLSNLGDIDDDNRPEWLVGALGYRPADLQFSVGAAYLISPADLLAADMADGQDGVLRAGEIRAQPRSWEFLVENRSDLVYTHVSAGGDINGDGVADVLLGMPDQSNAGLAYAVSGADLSELDAKDGTEDGRIDLRSIVSHDGSWKFMGEHSADKAGGTVGSAGDIDGDGQSDLIIGSPGGKAVYVVAAADLESADEADGKADSVIRLANVRRQSGSWKLLAESEAESENFAVAAGDVDGDGKPELLISSPGYSGSAGSVYIVSVDDLATADAADGSSDHIVRLGSVAGLRNSWKLLGEGGHHWSGASGSAAGHSLATFDLDGNAVSEVLISAPAFREDGNWCPSRGQQQQPGVVYLVSGSDLAAADAADGARDGVARLENVVLQQDSWKFSGEATDSLGSSVAAAGDLDGDGASDLIFGAAEQFGRYADCESTPGNGLAIVLSSADLANADRADGAEDGVVDFRGLRTSMRSADFDLDGVENELDSDDDNDGVSDASDDFPFDPLESSDNDNDGIGDNADTDDDNDGALDSVDAFPMNSLETLDSDGDGTGDNADSDDDNDGAADADDAFPFDATETADSDGDGIGDNADPEPDTKAGVEEVDTDGDGIADRLDDDDDNDGVDDALDLFDLDATRSDLYYFRLAGTARGFLGSDFDGDGLDDLVVGTESNTQNAYLVSAAELSTADEADGTEDRVVDFDQVTSLGKSWKFLGLKPPSEGRIPEVRHIAPAGDFDQDGLSDIVVAGNAGTFLIPASSLGSVDGVGGDMDRTINLVGAIASTATGAYALSGSSLGEGVYSLADLNTDGYSDLLFGNLWDSLELLQGNYYGRQPSSEAIYIVSGSEWSSSDGRDGSTDGTINLDSLASRPHTWKVTTDDGIDFGASVVACGDMNSDSAADLILGAPGHSSGTHTRSGRVFVLSGDDLGDADSADGSNDGVIEIDQSQEARIWTIDSEDLNTGMAISCLGDVDRDGLDDLIIEAQEGIYLLSGQDIKAGDAVDGSTDGNVQLMNVIAQAHSWNFRTTQLGEYEISGTGTGDIDDDGHSDVLVITHAAAHLLSGRELPEMEAVDGLVDIDHAPLPRRSWKLILTEEDVTFTGIASTADLNGDTIPELILESRNQRTGLVQTYVLSPSEFQAAASLQGLGGSVIYLDQIARRWQED